MTRLIDADALLEMINKATEHNAAIQDKRIIGDIVTIEYIITNAPTVQREGWVSVPTEPAIEQFKD